MVNMTIDLEKLSDILFDEGWYTMCYRILDEGIQYRSEKYAHPWESDEELMEYLELHIGQEELARCMEKLNNE